MTAVSNNISAYHWIPGISRNLTQALNEMMPPSILVYHSGLMGGNFDGMTLWKHHIEIYIRGANQAPAQALGQPITATEDIPYLMFNQPVNGGTLHIRDTSIMPGQLLLMDMPSFMHMSDLEGQDFFVAKCVIPEIGDQP